MASSTDQQPTQHCSWWQRIAAATSFSRASWLHIGIVVLVPLFVFWWLVPKWQVHGLHIQDAKTRGALEDNFRKTITQFLGGVAVLVGAAVAYWQFRQQQRAAHDLLISKQISKGFELLGNKEKIVSQRLGGIYALEAVMNGSEQYLQPVLEALCAFVRDETRTKTADDEPPTEIQAALTVIGRRNLGFGRLDLSGANLSRANLVLAYLFIADLRHANLNGAKLNGANLMAANLSGANLSKAQLLGARLSRAILGSADLTGADLANANLIGANLSRATLNGANLSNADLNGAFLVNADLSGADLSGARNLAQAQLDSAHGSENTKLDPPLTIKPCPKR